MAMRTASPWWASLVFGFGLLCVIIGERLFGHLGGARVFFTGILGLVPIIAVTALRLWTTLQTKGYRRNIERALLVCHVGTLVGLVLYAFTTKWGVSTFGIKNVDRWSGSLTVLYAILIVASLVPVLLIESSLGSARRGGIDLGEGEVDAGLDYFRVREVGWSGLTIAFALSFLFVTCQVAKERNITRDVSYFKTSAPGESTVNIVKASTEPLKVHLFFPETNEVKEQILTYFNRLKSDTGKVVVEAHDRLAETGLATKYKVGKDGVVVIARGEGDKEKNYTIELETDYEKARRATGSGAKLRNFDKEVNQLLMKLVREKRKAYLTVGHGEFTHPESLPAEMKHLERKGADFKKVMGALNYELKDLGLLDLAKDVPEDATLVIVAAPALPLQAAEWTALERYLDRGGRLMVIMDPNGSTTMSSLEGRLGLRMLPGHIADDKAFFPTRGTLGDRAWAITTQFSAHASTTALSRSGGRGIVMIDAGALEEIPFTSKGEAPKKTVTIRTMESAWLDQLNQEGKQNFQLDEGTEKRQRWNIGAAVEGPKVSGKDGFRALVFSDAELFADVPVPGPGGRMVSGMLYPMLLADSIRWLGGEEVFAGEVVSEDDKPVQHTKNQDVVWFAIMLVGVPLLVLGLGLFGTLGRRSRRRKEESNEEVTP
jgi:ABC-type uncharacterized transport system